MSKAYRLFCFDEAGRILSADWLVAANDDEALAVANHLDSGITREIWERSRFVGRTGPEAAVSPLF